MRPSNLLGFTNTWFAYQFDESVFEFGLMVENRLREQQEEGYLDIEAALGIEHKPKPISQLTGYAGVAGRVVSKPEGE